MEGVGEAWVMGGRSFAFQEKIAATDPSAKSILDQ
jgi:hypothetical protein